MPLVEARKKQNLKALMAELPAKTKYIIHNSLITMFEKAQAPRMAPAPLLLSVVRERATKSAPGPPMRAHTKWCARSRGFGSLHPLFLSVHCPIADLGAPATAGPKGWPFLGDARIRVEHFFHNHYMNNPPRKAEMKKGAKIMRDIKFRDEAPDKILNGFAVDAAARGLADLGPALTRVYDCWRDRLHREQFAAGAKLHNFLFLVDGQSACANNTRPPPWRRGVG